jgi:lipid-A-disaccharide synthase
MGLLEAASRLPALIRARNLVIHRFAESPPDLFVPVDFGGLNMRLARAARRRGISVVYYIPPKVWAWGGWRAHKLRRAVDEALVILPFEEGLLRGLGVPATYVGSPLLDQVSDRKFAPESDVVGLLPGSREIEVCRIWPTLLAAAELLSRRRKLRFLTPRAPGLSRATLEGPLRRSGLSVEILDEGGHQVMERSRLVLVASGTATLECALVGTPMVVVYRVHPVTYIAARLLVRVPFISLPNLIAGRQVVPELVQGGPEAVAEAAEPLLDDGPERARLTLGLAEVQRALGEGGATERAADRILARLKRVSCT